MNSVADFLEALSKQGIDGLIKKWRKTPLPSRLLRDAWQGCDADERVRTFIARYPLAPADLLAELADAEPASAVAVELVLHPRAPQEVFKFALEHSDPVVRSAVCQNKRLPSRLLHQLAQDESALVRAAAAANGLLKSDWQSRLAGDPDASVRAALTQHPQLEPDVAIVLAADPSPLVRASVVLLAPVSQEIMAEWAVSGDSCIEEALPGREDLHQTDAAWLIFSTNSRTRRAVAERWPHNHMLRTRMGLSPQTEDRVWLARQPDLSPGWQLFLAQDSEALVRQAIAELHTITSEAVDCLLQCGEPQLKYTLALNPGIKIEALQQMISDEDPQLLVNLLYRDDLPAEWIQEWVNHRRIQILIRHLAWMEAELPWLERSLARELAASELPLQRRLAATSHNLDPQTMEALAEDPDSTVRTAAANNSSLSDILLDALCFDDDESVCQPAKRILTQRRKPKKATAATAKIKQETTGKDFQDVLKDTLDNEDDSGWFQKLRNRWSGLSAFTG